MRQSGPAPSRSTIHGSSALTRLIQRFWLDRQVNDANTSFRIQEDHRTMANFLGQGVIVTGALRIYGTWIADAFARAGAKLCLTDRDGAALDARLAQARGAEGSFAVAA